jgi:hypothetical protein
MEAWAEWAQSHAKALPDPRARLFRKRLVTSNRDAKFTDSKTGYANCSS